MDPRVTAAAHAALAQRPVDTEALHAFVKGEGPLGAAFNLNADDGRAVRERGLALLDGGQAQEARVVFEALLVLGDTDPGVRLLLANACEATGDLDAAIEHFEQASAQMLPSPMRDAAMTWGRELLASARRRLEDA